MPLRSVIDIDVRDQSFRDFAERWRRYQEALAKAPGQWQQQTVRIKNAKSAFDALVFDAIALNEQQRLLNRAQREADRITESIASKWGRLARHAQTFAGAVHGVAGNLLRLAGPTALISGLLGAGSLFGLERLGLAAANNRRSSLGLGVGAGEQRAFELNFQRLVDAPGFLGGVAEALRGPNRFALYGLGLTEQELQGRSAAQVSALGIQRLKQRVDRTPENQLDFLAGSLGLDRLGLTGEDLMRLRRTSAAEVAGVGAQFGKDTRGLGSLDATLRAWQEFTVQMDRAGQKIETALINNLVKLAPQLERLSDDVVKALTDPGLLEHLKQFASDIAELSGSLRGFVSWVRSAAAFQVPSPSDLGRRAGEATRGLIGDAFHALGGTVTAGLGIKAGAGVTEGMLPFVRRLRADVPGIAQFTAGEDAFHRGFSSAHNEGRALDLTVSDPSKAGAVAEMIKSELRAMGVAGTVKVEGYGAAPLSRHGTAPHIHVQTTNRIDVSVPTGSNVVTSSRQVAQ